MERIIEEYLAAAAPGSVASVARKKNGYALDGYTQGGIPKVRNNESFRYSSTTAL